MEKQISPDETDRLALLIMQDRKIRYEQALTVLSCLKLHIVCGEDLAASAPLQSALLTAINAGKRAFRGGVTVELKAGAITLGVSWPNPSASIQEIIKELGATLAIRPAGPDIATLLIGNVPGKETDIRVVANEWQAGILSGSEHGPFACTGRTPLAGAAAAALGLASAFLMITGIDRHILYQETGISLWRPDLNWLDRQAEGPAITCFPKRLWVLGLGHLGQAYLWLAGLFAFPDPAAVEFVLQDFDRLSWGNWSAGLLADDKVVGQFKSRICMKWLEDRGMTTRLYERAFDDSMRLQEGEPLVVLCGLDKAIPRMSLEKPGWALVIEAGIGGKLGDFDKIALHTFPDSHKSPDQLWNEEMDKREVLHQHVLEAFTDQGLPCGVVAETVASTAISTAFVGTSAASLVLAEALRGLHGGRRFDTLSLQLRDMAHKKAFRHQREDSMEALVSNGYVSLAEIE